MCTRLLAVGHFAHADATGANRLHFTGRVAHRALPVGSYTLRAVPKAGHVSGRPVTARFQIK
jgi:hypothetical protein